MAAELGAALALMDQTTPIPAIQVPGENNDGHQLYRLFFQELARPHSLVVNEAGKRFANETFFSDLARGWNHYNDDCADWPNVPMYFILDDQYRRSCGLPGSLDVGACLTTHPDITSLARSRNIDAQGLHKQIRRSTRMPLPASTVSSIVARPRISARSPPDRSAVGNPTIGSVAVPPYHCLELFLTSGHRGGLVTDGAARVLDVRGVALPACTRVEARQRAS